MTREIKEIIVHCSDTPEGSAASIRRYHMAMPPDGRGWTDIGYHFVIIRDGTVELGRPEDRVGAHCHGHNENSLGICLVGVEQFMTAQWEALKILCESLMNKYGLPIEALHCHYEYDSAKEQGKTCPNFSVDELRNLFKGA